MAVQVVTAEYADPSEFSRFVERELKRGHAIVKEQPNVDLFDEVILRVVVNEAAIDIVATVAHPALPDSTGTPMLGLAVSLTPDQRYSLEDLGEWLNQQRAVTAEFDVALDTDVGPLEGLAATDVGRPRVESTVSRSSIVRSSFAEMFDSAPHQLVPAPDTPVNTSVLASMISDSLAQRAPASEATAVDRFGRGSVDAIIDSVARGEASSERDAFNRDDAGEAAQYRANYPDKAMRADDYFRAAMADAQNRQFELARTNVNLAMAYNPTVSEYRELLERVELELGVRAY